MVGVGGVTWGLEDLIGCFLPGYSLFRWGWGDGIKRFAGGKFSAGDSRRSIRWRKDFGGR